MSMMPEPQGPFNHRRPGKHSTKRSAFAHNTAQMTDPLTRTLPKFIGFPNLKDENPGKKFHIPGRKSLSHPFRLGSPRFRFDDFLGLRENRVIALVGLWRSWERASMAWKRSSVRSRPGPPIFLNELQAAILTSSTP